MNTRIPGCELSCALKPLPDCWRDGYTIMQQIESAFAFGYHDPLFGKKAEVVRLAVETSYWRQESDGHGNRAARRAADIETARWFAEREAEDHEDPDAFAKQYAKDRNLNYHDL